MHGSNVEYKQLNCAEARKHAPRPAPDPPPISMPYTDRRIGWHLDLAHRGALIGAYKKRCPAPVILLVSVSLSNSTSRKHSQSCASPRTNFSASALFVYYPQAPAVSHMVTQLFLSCIPLPPCIDARLNDSKLSLTLISIEYLHNCQINVLCS